MMVPIIDVSCVPLVEDIPAQKPQLGELRSQTRPRVEKAHRALHSCTGLTSTASLIFNRVIGTGYATFLVLSAV